MALKSDTAAEKSKDQLSRDFSGRSIFDFCNNIVASLMLPFLPMLPIQVLLNNLLYDLSEVPIPMDEVDDELLAQPRHWDIKFIRNFMLVLGSVSSIVDFLTFGLLLWVFKRF